MTNEEAVEKALRRVFSGGEIEVGVTMEAGLRRRFGKWYDEPGTRYLRVSRYPIPEGLIFEIMLADALEALK